MNLSILSVFHFNFQADVIVNSVDYDLVLSKGRSSNAIAEEGGSSIQSECQSKYPSGISEDEVAITGGGNLNCKNIYHITLPKWDDSNKEVCFRNIKYQHIRTVSNLHQEFIV